MGRSLFHIADVFCRRHEKTGRRLSARNRYLDHVEHDGKCNEEDCDPLGELCKLCVKRLGLILGHKSICAAGDCTGQARALSGLEKNNGYKKQAGQKLDYSDGDLQNDHSFQIVHGKMPEFFK